jgi:hypothetical protein
LQLINVDVPLDFNIFLLGDQHIGARLFDQDGWDATVEMIRSPYEGCKSNYVVHHGDAIEGILVDDPRYGIEETVDSRVFTQMSMWKETILPIKEQVICLLTGNHEFKLQRFGDITKKLCEETGITYGTYSSIISYRHDGRTLFKHYATHGRRTLGSIADDEIRRRANMQLQLKRCLYPKHGTCALMSRGHAHKVLVAPPNRELYISDDGRKLQQNYTAPPDIHNGFIHPNLRWYANCGSYLKTFGIGFSSYSERGDYNPTELGFCCALVRGGRLVNVREEKI